MASITVMDEFAERRIQDHINKCEKQLSLLRYDTNCPEPVKNAISELMLAVHSLLDELPIEYES